MYLGILFSLFVLASWQNVFHSSTIRSSRNIIFYWLCILILISLSSLRWERGTDWESYYFFYYGFDAITMDSYMEPGFNLFTSINKAIAPFYTFQLFMMAILSICCIAVTIYKYSIFPFISLLVWFSMSLANLFPVRQTIAVALLVYASKYIINKEKYKFIVILCIAISFHYSALVYSAAYYLFHKHYSRYCLIIMLFIGIVIAIMLESFVSNILYTFGGDFFQERLSYYIETSSDENFGSAYSPQEVLFRGIANRSLLFVIPILFLEKKRQSDVVFNGFFNLYCFAFVLFVLLVPISPVLGRLATYYDYAQFFLIPYFFLIPFSRKSLYFIFFLIILYCMIRFNGVVQNYKDEYIPYKSVFSI